MLATSVVAYLVAFCSNHFETHLPIVYDTILFQSRSRTSFCFQNSESSCLSGGQEGGGKLCDKRLMVN